MSVIVFVQLQVFCHRYKTDRGHPGAPEVSSLRGSFAGFEQKYHCLHCTEARYILETLFML
jgi:hypothetical protein